VAYNDWVENVDAFGTKFMALATYAVWAVKTAPITPEAVIKEAVNAREEETLEDAFVITPVQSPYNI
jgi:hypothetical protein